MSDEETQDEREVFRYDGPVYFRPIGRGICFSRPFMWRGEEVPADRLQVEELFEGDFEMEIVIRRPASTDD
jgi:hypothetical protein